MNIEANVNVSAITGRVLSLSFFVPSPLVFLRSQFTECSTASFLPRLIFLPAFISSRGALGEEGKEGGGSLALNNYVWRAMNELETEERAEYGGGCGCCHYEYDVRFQNFEYP